MITPELISKDGFVPYPRYSGNNTPPLEAFIFKWKAGERWRLLSCYTILIQRTNSVQRQIRCGEFYSVDCRWF